MQPEITGAPQVPRQTLNWWRVFGILIVILAPVGYLLSMASDDMHRVEEIRNERDYMEKASTALERYVDDHGQRYPNMSGDMAVLLHPYINDPKLLAAMSHFVWNESLSGKNARDVDPTAWVVFWGAYGLDRYTVSCEDSTQTYYVTGRGLSDIIKSGKVDPN